MMKVGNQGHEDKGELLLYLKKQLQINNAALTKAKTTA
jgi:hypothetical protein